jgi:hypothetical protein
LKRYLIKVLLLGALSVALPNLTGVALLHFNTEHMFRTALHHWVGRLEIEPRVLVMGSSTVMYGVSPKIVTEKIGARRGAVVNISAHSRTAVQSYVEYLNLRGRVAKSPLVLYGIDSWILGTRYFHHDRFLPMLWTPGERYAFFAHQKPERWKKQIPKHLLGLDPYRLYETITRPAGRGPRNEESVGWEIPPDLGGRKLNKRPKNFEADLRARWFRFHEGFGLSSFVIDHLGRLKEAVEADGGRFVLVVMPRRSDWRRSYKETCSEIDDEIGRRLDARLGDTVVVGSMSAIPRKKERKAFADAAHLNPRGQRILSRQLAGVIEKVEELEPKPIKPLRTYKPTRGR